MTWVSVLDYPGVRINCSWSSYHNHQSTVLEPKSVCVGNGAGIAHSSISWKQNLSVIFKLLPPCPEGCPPCPEGWWYSPVPGTWQALGGALEPSSRALPGLAIFLRIDVSCKKLSGSFLACYVLFPCQCPQPIIFYLPWQFVPRPRGDVPLSIIWQLSICFCECYLHTDSMAWLLLAFSIHWASQLPC